MRKCGHRVRDLEIQSHYICIHHCNEQPYSDKYINTIVCTACKKTDKEVCTACKKADKEGFCICYYMIARAGS